MTNSTEQHLILEALTSWLDSLVEYLSFLDSLTQPGRLTTDEQMLPSYIALRDDLALVIYAFIGERTADSIEWRELGAAVAKCFDSNKYAVQASLLTDSEALTTNNECHPNLVEQTLAGHGLHIRLVEKVSAAVEPSSDEDGPF